MSNCGGVAVVVVIASLTKQFEFCGIFFIYNII